MMFGFITKTEVKGEALVTVWVKALKLQCVLHLPPHPVTAYVSKVLVQTICHLKFKKSESGRRVVTMISCLQHYYLQIQWSENKLSKTFSLKPNVPPSYTFHRSHGLQTYVCLPTNLVTFPKKTSGEQFDTILSCVVTYL